jgi:hypothetical protein
VKLALDQTVREIEFAEKQEAEAREKIWRENFRPHAIILNSHRAHRAKPDVRGRNRRRRETVPDRP